MDKKIVIFDSGFGGLSVLRDILKYLPNEQYLYYCDTRNVPYGQKTQPEIIALTERAIQNIGPETIEAFVIACNTATSAAAETLRKKYDFPVIGIEPAIKPASQNNQGNILVLATPFTLKEKKFNDLVVSLNLKERIIKVPAPELVLLVEQGNCEEQVLNPLWQKYFRDIAVDKVSSIVLGCTHYVFLKPQLSAYFQHKMPIYDGNDGISRMVFQLFASRQKKQGGQILFRSTGNAVTTYQTARKLWVDFLGGRDFIWRG